MTFKYAFLTVFILSLIVKIYLSFRQSKTVKALSISVPERFTNSINLADHQKAANYTIEKQRLARFSSVVDFALLFSFLFLDGFKLILDFVSNFSISPIFVGILFIYVVILITNIIELPFSLYKTFILENKYGFNKMTFKLWCFDLVKSTIIGLIFMTPILYLLLFFFENLSSLWWLYSWVLIVITAVFLQFIAPTFIAPIFNKFKPIEDLELKSKLENLLSKCGFRSNGMFVMDGSTRSSHGNAYFTGFGSSKRIVFFDTLLSKLSHSEIEAVLAHELGHFKKNHVKKRLFLMLALSFFFFYILGFFHTNGIILDSFGFSTSVNNAVALTLYFTVIPVFFFILKPVFSISSRKDEFEADAFAAEKSDSNQLINALVKLYKDNASTLTPDKLYSMWYDSHPSAHERINRLESY